MGSEGEIPDLEYIQYGKIFFYLQLIEIEKTTIFIPMFDKQV